MLHHDVVEPLDPHWFRDQKGDHRPVPNRSDLTVKWFAREETWNGVIRLVAPRSHLVVAVASLKAHLLKDSIIEVSRSGKIARAYHRVSNHLFFSCLIVLDGGKVRKNPLYSADQPFTLLAADVGFEPLLTDAAMQNICQPHVIVPMNCIPTSIYCAFDIFFRVVHKN